VPGKDGTFGLRQGIRTFKDVAQDSSWGKHILAELYPGLAVTEWAVHSGSVYVAPLVRSHDDVRLDVGKVTTLQGGLTRSFVDDPANLAAGEFWFDVDEDAGEARWDDGSTRWDDGVTEWDKFVKLYIRLPDSTDPDLDEVEAEFRLTFASSAQTHPALGPNKLANPSFENWTGGSPDGWTVQVAATAAGGTVTMTDGENGTTDPYLGEAALQFNLTNVSAGGFRQAYQTHTLTAGRRYRFSGAYRTSAGAGDLVPWLWVWETGGDHMHADGVNLANAGESLRTAFEPTEGEWRRWTFDFVCPETLTWYFIMRGYARSGIVTGTIEFDDVRVMDIERFHYYEPRISGAAVPSISTASNDIFFGGKQIGVGSLALLNHDRYFETLSTLDWVNRKVIMRVGAGYLPEEGGTEELVAVDDYRVAFTALVQQIKTDDVEFALDIQDIRSTYFRTLPPRTFSVADFSNVADKDEGAVRALWFGNKLNVRPIRYADAAEYGNWELADCDDAPNGILGITNVWNYVDEDAVREAVASGVSTRRVSSAYRRTNLNMDTRNGTAFSNHGLYQTSATGGWDYGGYDSVNTITPDTDDARIEWTNVNQGSTTPMMGLTDSTADWSHASLDFAVYMLGDGAGSDTYQIRELGSNVFDTPYACWKGDRLRIAVALDGTVTYWLNGHATDGWTLMYTSLVSASGLAVLYARMASYQINATVTGLGLYKRATKHHTEDLATARIAITHDLKPIEVTRENNKGSFHNNTYHCFVNPGTYTPDELGFQFAACAWAQAWNASFGWSYNHSTQKGTLLSSASHKWDFSSGEHTDIYKVLGFTQDDSAAATTSDAAESTASGDVDDEYILRADGQGYKDDGSGTYTGSASALIETGSDILRTILVALLKQPATIIDEASFQFARDRAPESLSVHMNKERSVKDIMTTLEHSNIANISIGGDATVYYDVYVGAVPAGTVELEGPDFASFGVKAEYADVYKTVRVFYGEDPGGEGYPFKYTQNNDVETRFGRPDVKEFRTWITAEDGAQTTSFRMAELAKAPPRQVIGAVRGKLLDHRVGQKIRITRDRASAAGGLLSSSAHRLISLRHNFALGMTQFVAVPDLVTVASKACETTCQSYCESVCQASCETACQTECQLSTCEIGCEVSCELACQLACQDTCELACQAACELTAQCDPTCQAACQSACQSACQYACQYECQQTCEKSCQTACELGCQTACELACQDTCEVSCQSSCELYCQSSCEWECQSAYQYNYF
jgi:hypothetical protein